MSGVVVLVHNYLFNYLKMKAMEKLLIVGISAMLSFFAFNGDKPWAKDKGYSELKKPCIEKPNVGPQTNSVKPHYTPPS